MRREGACEVEGKRDATWEASRQPSVFMLTRRYGHDGHGTTVDNALARPPVSGANVAEGRARTALVPIEL